VKLPDPISALRGHIAAGDPTLAHAKKKSVAIRG
jgi:hypothetical protein